MFQTLDGGMNMQYLIKIICVEQGDLYHLFCGVPW